MNSQGLTYSPVVHFSGTVAQSQDLTSHVPWVYVIVGVRQKIIYIGETFDQSGLIARLSTHFGPYPQSSLRQCAAKHAGVHRLKAPFLVFAARLPYERDDIDFDGSSKKTRMKIEATLHEHVANKYAAKQKGWTLVSSASPSDIKLSQDMEAACDSIFHCFLSGVLFFESLSDASPWNLVLLDYYAPTETPPSEDVGGLIEAIEVRLFEWLLSTLKAAHGERWWTEGVPEPVRVQCVTRREQEGEGERLPSEAYLLLIDIKDIVKKNWAICGGLMEGISGEQGKDKATKWITDLNEVRKLWAHPVKRLYNPMHSTKVLELQELHRRAREALEKHAVSGIG